MKRIRKTVLAEADINLTPLIDVCFVILIMFIVVAPLLDTQKIELAPSGPSSSPLKKKQALTIQVAKDNTITVNQQKVLTTQLKEVLQKARPLYLDGNVQLIHDRNASFGTYQTIKNALEEAGFKEMDLMLKKE